MKNMKLSEVLKHASEQTNPRMISAIDHIKKLTNEYPTATQDQTVAEYLDQVNQATLNKS